MPKTMKIYLNLLQLCIVKHRLFFFRDTVYNTTENRHVLVNNNTM